MYDTVDEAKKHYHAELAEAIDSPTFDHITCILNDSFGNSIQSEYWSKLTPEVAIQ